nr:chaperone protein DnaJ 49-like [Tanacetum cinerariifolium]
MALLRSNSHFWEELVQAFTRSFGLVEFQNPDEFLCSIKQTGSVHEYRQEFAKISSRVSNWPDHCLLGVFLNGLKDELKLDVLEANEDVEEPLTTDLTNLESDPEETAEISLHAILGKPHPTTMKVHDVLVNELKLATQPLTPFGFQIGNGDVIRCGQICKNLPVQIIDLKITQEFPAFRLEDKAFYREGRLGDRVKALQFITKAKRLDPLLQIDDLLKNLDEKNGFSKSPENAASGDAEEGSGGGSKVLGNGSGQVNGLGNGSSLGTNEQMTIVWEIRRKKDYYDILGVSKDFGIEDIRKADLKLSLKVYPDKNKAPRSEEAFKKLSKVYECLSDAESRKKYNVMGSEEPMSYIPPARRRASQNEFSYEGDIDAEEVCRNFFFGGMNPRATKQFSGFIFSNRTRVMVFKLS